MTKNIHTSIIMFKIQTNLQALLIVLGKETTQTERERERERDNKIGTIYYLGCILFRYF